jgi:hypothetical protein
VPSGGMTPPECRLRLRGERTHWQKRRRGFDPLTAVGHPPGVEQSGPASYWFPTPWQSQRHSRPGRASREFKRKCTRSISGWFTC